MLAFLRIVAVVIALVAVGYTIAYFRSGNPVHLKIAKRTFIGGIVTALVFFAVMFAQRLIE